jgi:FkbM family methyltransferase
MSLLGKLRTARNLLSEQGVSAIGQTAAIRMVGVGRRIQRWLVKDRAWLGRLLALSGNNVRIEGCRFSFAHPQVTDELRCRALLGRYERSERELLGRHLDPELPVVELGGGLGVIACLTNRRLVQPAAHVVVEANPNLIPLIETQRARNDCRFTVINGAIDYSGNSHVTLRVDREFISARVESSGETSVPTITLAQVLDRTSFTPCTLICDIEGAETELVAHESGQLARRIKTFIVETHPKLRSDEERAAMSRRLAEAGFVEIDAVRKVRVYAHEGERDGRKECVRMKGGDGLR